MRVAVRAWELRQATRAALCAGDRATEALALARAACQLHTTPSGQRLLALALLVNGHMAELIRCLRRRCRHSSLRFSSSERGRG